MEALRSKGFIGFMGGGAAEHESRAPSLLTAAPVVMGLDPHPRKGLGLELGLGLGLG